MALADDWILDSISIGGDDYELSPPGIAFSDAYAVCDNQMGTQEDIYSYAWAGWYCDNPIAFSTSEASSDVGIPIGVSSVASSRDIFFNFLVGSFVEFVPCDPALSPESSDQDNTYLCPEFYGF